MNWIKTTESQPDHNYEVMALTPSGDIVSLRYQDGLWFVPDMSMYVYYTPTHWQELPF